MEAFVQARLLVSSQEKQQTVSESRRRPRHLAVAMHSAVPSWDRLKRFSDEDRGGFCSGASRCAGCGGVEARPGQGLLLRGCGPAAETGTE